VLGEELRVPRAVLLEEPGRSLDVREEEGDRAAGESADRHVRIITYRSRHGPMPLAASFSGEHRLDERRPRPGPSQSGDREVT
jgi:hypothetical protein